VPELFFCGDLRGYGWCFRKGDHLNIGLGRSDPRRLSAHLAQFLEFLRQSGKVTCALPEHFAGHAYQLYERVPPKLTADGALLLGDAAGLAYPQSGEGIRPAVESGLLAAEVILQAGGHCSREQLQGYEYRILSRFGPPRRPRNSSRIPAAWLQPAAARLLRTRWFARRVVMDRWFLHRQEPALRTSSPVSRVESSG
jgi:flavin-dependent dehydrogenase